MRLILVIVAVSMVHAAPKDVELQAINKLMLEAYDRDESGLQAFQSIKAQTEIDVDEDKKGVQALQSSMAEAEDDKEDAEVQAFDTLMAEAQKPDGDDETFEAQLQEVFAREQMPVRAQKFWRKFWRGTRRFFRKAWKIGKKIWRFFG